MFKYYSLWMSSTRIAFVHSNLANLSALFFTSELILVQNGTVVCYDVLQCTAV